MRFDWKRSINATFSVLTELFLSATRTERDLPPTSDEMAYLVARLFGSYYLSKQRHDSKILHYYRTPTWRSLVLFLSKTINFSLYLLLELYNIMMIRFQTIFPLFYFSLMES